jgi:hypothetical protein
MKLLFCILTVIFLISCDKQVPTEKLTIIDNFVLGQSSINLSKQMDSLFINRKRFFTKQILSKFDDLLDDNNFINMYSTNTFNLSNYRSSSNEHVGLLYPITLTGTKNVTGMTILLTHTSKPWFFGDTKKFESSVDDKLIKQEVNKDLIDEIKNMYISKYGQPIIKFKSTTNAFYIIEGSQIKNYSGNPDREGEMLTWETDYYTVRFFTGLPSYESLYQANKRTYKDIMNLGGPNYIMTADPLKDEAQSFSYPYIEYELNSKAIKEFKLNNKNL